MGRGGRRRSLSNKDTKLIALVIFAIVAGLLYVLTYMESPDGHTSNGNGQYFTGTVTEIVDGDTLYVDNVKIRLALVDTPEYYESGYHEATQFVEDMCPVGSQATVDQDDLQLYDSYGRMLAVVSCGGKNLNKELLEHGHAEILTQYCDESEFQDQSWAREHGC